MSSDMIDRHSRYLSTRDGIFRVIVDGPRPNWTSSERFDSTSSAFGILSIHLAEGGYRRYARGVNRLCPPDGMAEARLSDLSLREYSDDLLLSRGVDLVLVSLISDH